MSTKNYEVTLLFFLSFFNLLYAEVILDGTTGPAQAITANASNYEIHAELGTTVGSNLFHSFKNFNVEAGHSATFHGSTQIQSILSRVTGGQASTINGMLRTQGTNADLYILNPAGVIFGEGSSLDLGGSLHVSTADQLKLGDTGVFAAKNPDQSLLVSDPPSAFGFVENNTASIQLSGSSLRVAEGEQISVIGSNVDITNSLLEARSGRINIVAEKQSGDVSIHQINENQNQIKATGTLKIKDSTTLNTGWFGGGTVLIRAGQFELQNSKVDVSTLDLPIDDVEESGGDIYVNAKELTIEQGSQLIAASYNSKEGGSINLNTDNLTLDNSSLNASSASEGNGGGINIQTKGFRLQNNSNVQLQSYAQGMGGTLDLNAEEIVLKGEESIITADASYPKLGVDNSAASGKGGQIKIQSKSIEISEGANLSAGTWGKANSGSIDLKTDHLTLDGAYISVSTRKSSGRGGDLKIEADDTLTVKNGASIASYTWHDGAAGTVNINANHVIVDGNTAQASINGETYGSQKGPHLILSGNQLSLSNGAKLSASSKGSGDAGDVDLQFDNVKVESGAQISSRSFESGQGGDIKIKTKTLLLQDEAEISSEVLESAEGGLIDIQADELQMHNARIFGDTGGSGKAADISIQADTITMQGSSQISSTAVAQGHGGQISVKVNHKLVTSGSGDFDQSQLRQALDEKRSGTQSIAVERQKETLIDREILALQNRQRTESAIDATATQLEIDNKFNERKEVITRIIDQEKLANQKRSTFHGFMLGSAGEGNSGNLLIEAPAIILSRGAGITAASLNNGQSGNISIEAPTMVLEGGASISGTSFGAGDGGKIEVKSQEIQLSNAAYIQSESHGDGEAGNIALIDADKIRLLNNSRVSTLARKSDGGNIEIKAINLVHLDHSEITAEVRSGLGNGGNIDIDPEYVILNDGRIIANAYGGNGGNIKIVAQTFLGTPQTVISASSQLGLDGVVEIDAPQIDLSGSLLDLNLEFIDSDALIPRLCLPANFEQRNSFQVTRQKWLPPTGLLLPWSSP